MRILVTGSTGLVGYHVFAALAGANAHARFNGNTLPYDICVAGRNDFESSDRLENLLKGVDAVIHLAAINRPREEEKPWMNESLAERLISALDSANSLPILVYTNSTQAERSVSATEYGEAKAAAAAHFESWACRKGAQFVHLTLPHVFGEGGRPHHNTVTATLCANAVEGVTSTINEGAAVELIHAGAVADEIMAQIHAGRAIDKRLKGRAITVSELDNRILEYRDSYRNGVIPDVTDTFTRDLFNTYRWHEFPNRFPVILPLHRDPRGNLFEAVKGGGGGQTFLSWTEPGITRGNHFHRRKIERFLVLEGEAMIRLRPLRGDQVFEFRVSGSEPAYVDMPTLYTHNIENVGQTRLLTLFWAHEVFDPTDPDTYSQEVQASDLHGT